MAIEDWFPDHWPQYEVYHIVRDIFHPNFIWTLALLLYQATPWSPLLRPHPCLHVSLTFLLGLILLVHLLQVACKYQMHTLLLVMFPLQMLHQGYYQVSAAPVTLPREPHAFVAPNSNVGVVSGYRPQQGLVDTQPAMGPYRSSLETFPGPTGCPYQAANVQTVFSNRTGPVSSVVPFPYQGPAFFSDTSMGQRRPPESFAPNSFGSPPQYLPGVPSGGQPYMASATPLAGGMNPPVDQQFSGNPPSHPLCLHGLPLPQCGSCFVDPPRFAAPLPPPSVDFSQGPTMSASSWRAPSAPPLLTPPDQLSRGQRILPLKLKVPKGVKNGINQHKSMDQKDRHASSEGSPRHRSAPPSGKDKWFPSKAEKAKETETRMPETKTKASLKARNPAKHRKCISVSVKPILYPEESSLPAVDTPKANAGRVKTKAQRKERCPRLSDCHSTTTETTDHSGKPQSRKRKKAAKRPAKKNIHGHVDMEQWTQMPNKVLDNVVRRLLEIEPPTIQEVNVEPAIYTRRSYLRQLIPDLPGTNGKDPGTSEVLLLMQLPFATLRSREKAHRWLDTLISYHEHCILKEARCCNACPYMGATEPGYRLTVTDLKVTKDKFGYSQDGRKGNTITGRLVDKPVIVSESQ